MDSHSMYLPISFIQHIYVYATHASTVVCVNSSPLCTP